MRFPAAASNSGMLAKWRPAMVMTASSSGWGSEPPSMVIVPSQLITVVTPSSSYGLPLCPKPLTCARARAAPLLEENNFRGVRRAPATAPRLPRKPRRFHFELSRIKICSCVSLTSYGGHGIDFHQGISRQRRHRNRLKRGPAMREICGENLVHSIPVLDFHQKDIRLNHAVHG